MSLGYGSVIPSRSSSESKTLSPQRLTVYNHFPYLGDLLGACQHSFLTKSPPPDIAPIGSKRSALAQLETALANLYRWYRANVAIERYVQHDRRLVAEEIAKLMRRAVANAVGRG